jgi:murein DD-endopeptidase MepM/ murein hydrolase activator NlpD
VAPVAVPLPAIETVPAGAFAFGAEGPVGCPVAPAAGAVVTTQGYGVGSHAPADIWGAVDLAVDGDGDGAADPDASWGATVVATHAGTATATPNSHPAGNHVWIVGDGGWKTGYSHLAEILVATGDQVRVGQPIGLLGSTGLSSGPHLDYQVWRDGVNVDPTWLVQC